MSPAAVTYTALAVWVALFAVCMVALVGGMSLAVALTYVVQVVGLGLIVAGVVMFGRWVQ